MDSATRDVVRGRAAGICEYCRLPEWAHERPFHVEHIVARQHGGDDGIENLALACDRCNLHKGPTLSGIDPESSQIVPLFHPRRHTWSSHFRLRSAVIEGLSPTGRATVRLLEMNVWQRVRLRRKIGLIET
jgi:5-methylcytosine-specific restriction endonuclease McrA